MKTKVRPIVIGTLSVFAVVACLALVVPTQSADAENTTEETTTVTSTAETETTTVTESTEETTVAQTEATVAQTSKSATYSAPQTEAYVAPAAQTEAYVAPAPQTYYNQVEFLGYYFNVGPVLANNIYDKSWHARISKLYRLRRNRSDGCTTKTYMTVLVLISRDTTLELWGYLQAT